MPVRKESDEVPIRLRRWPPRVGRKRAGAQFAGKRVSKHFCTDPEGAESHEPGGCAQILFGSQTGGGGYCCGKSRRDTSEQQFSCRFSPGKSADPKQRDRHEFRVRREETALPRQFVYLPEAGATADS